jgi:hypothetical protein
MECRDCGVSLPAEARFCFQCGASRSQTRQHPDRRRVGRAAADRLRNREGAARRWPAHRNRPDRRHRVLHVSGASGRTRRHRRPFGSVLPRRGRLRNAVRAAAVRRGESSRGVDHAADAGSATAPCSCALCRRRSGFTRSRAVSNGNRRTDGPTRRACAPHSSPATTTGRIRWQRGCFASGRRRYRCCSSHPAMPQHSLRGVEPPEPSQLSHRPGLASRD